MERLISITYGGFFTIVKSWRLTRVTRLDILNKFKIIMIIILFSIIFKIPYNIMSSIHDLIFI